ncbi:MAG: copper amine oxidase N-terminal domain-containing protein [Deltaproteobacteria bacterium]
MKNRRSLAIILGLCIMLSLLPGVVLAGSEEYVYIVAGEWIQVQNNKTIVPLKGMMGSQKGTISVGASVSPDKGQTVITQGNFTKNDCVIMDGTFVSDTGAIYTIKNLVPTLTSPPTETKTTVTAPPVISAPTPSVLQEAPKPSASQLSGSSQNQKIKVVLDGKTLSFTQDPVIQNGSVLVPFRKILEELGTIVEYDVNSHQIEAICQSKGMVILFSAGNPDATMIYAGGKTQTYKMNQPAIVINNTTLVPVRFISEALGNQVTWDAQSKTVGIVGQQAAPAASVADTKPLANASDNKIKITVTKVTRAEGNPAPNQNEVYITREHGFLNIYYMPQNKSGTSYKQTYTSTAESGYEYIVIEFQADSNTVNLKKVGHAESTLYDTFGKGYQTDHWINYGVEFGNDWRNEWMLGDNARCEIDFLVPKGTTPDYMDLEYSYQDNSGEHTGVLKVPLAGKI